MSRRFFAVLLIVLLLVIAAVLIHGEFSGQPAAVDSSFMSDSPENIHLTWEDDTSTTITVTWQTSLGVSGDSVLFDVVSRGGESTLYSYSASGTNHSYSGSSGYIHDVKLTGLTPDTAYYFVCGGDVGGWSDERGFRTAPSVSSDVRFVVGGDSRTDWVERDKISQAMAEFNPAFAINFGDLVNDGTIQSDWNSWFTDVHENWIGENGLIIPVIPVLGNHEYPNDSSTKYFEQFALPGNERWYSYDWGPDIHITCLDCYSSPSGEQLAWLQNDLATHANYLWKFVVFHEPVFVSGTHDPWEAGLMYWVPLFDEYHVNIVFSGHEHNYQRSYPLNWTESQTETRAYSNGTTYIVSGSWGAPLYSPTPIWYMAHQSESHHFCLIDIYENGTLHLQAKDNLGITFDEMKIIQRPNADFSASPTSGEEPLPVTFTDLSLSQEGIVSWVWGLNFNPKAKRLLTLRLCRNY